MSNQFSRHGILFVLSAPSGAGKTTLCEGLRQTPDFIYSVSCTTRAPRPGERDEKDYFFLSEEEFLQRVKRGEFLEHAQVHGKFYGTLRSTVTEHLKKGVDVLIDIDTVGAAQIRACEDPAIRAAHTDIFIMPPSLEELRQRLMRRGTETAEQVDLRVSNAAREMAFWREYRYTIVSGSMEEDLQAFRSIMRAERARSHRLQHTPI